VGRWVGTVATGCRSARSLANKRPSWLVSSRSWCTAGGGCSVSWYKLLSCAWSVSCPSGNVPRAASGTADQSRMGEALARRSSHRPGAGYTGRALGHNAGNLLTNERLVHVRLPDVEVHGDLIDLTRVPLGELRGLRTPELKSAISLVLERSKLVAVDDIQGQAQV
jgi:hypothetical protein